MTPSNACDDGVDLFVGQIQRKLPRVRLVHALGADRQEAGGDELLGALLVVLCRQQIAGDLLAQELVVRLVLVERRDDVVAIAPGMRVSEVDVLARALRIAGHVQPVAAPSLAELRRGEQAVHDLAEGIRRAVLEKRVDVLRASAADR